MPTPAERKALAFVAFVILLGSAVRIVRGGALESPSPSPDEQFALARQTYSASSSAVIGRAEKGGKGRRSARAAPKRRDGVVKFDFGGVLGEGSAPLNASGFPPPSPRIDIDMRIRPAAASASGTAGVTGEAAPHLDLDVADAGQIERLPRIGPALARRIVASRDSMGSFGSLAGLGRVKGVGPAILDRLAPLVTFSGQVRR